jgi:hypothetical protein
MSKSSKSSVVENELIPEVEEKVVSEKLAISPVAQARVISPTTKIGVVKYLQLYPQPADIAALMKKKYAMQVHTIAEWDSIVDRLLNS